LYAGEVGEGEGLSLAGLIADLDGFAVEEIATVDGRLCLLARRGREKSRAAAWRRALGVAERELAESERAVVALRASADALEASREREERALADARDDVARLETALAAATHERDRRQEEARLASEGVAVLEQRIERLRTETERGRAEAERAAERRDAEAAQRTAEAERALERETAEAAQRLAEAERRRERETAEAAQRLAEAERAAERRDAEAAQRTVEAERALERETAEAAQRLTEAERRREREVAAVEQDRAVQLAAAEKDLAAAHVRLEGREEELQRSQAAAQQAGQELSEVRERLTESERDLAVRERDLAARVRELGVAGDQLIARERELETVGEQLAARERELETLREQLAAREGELEAAGNHLAARERELETAGERLAARDGELDAAGTLLERQGAELDEVRARLEARERHLENAKQGIEARDRRLEVAEEKLERARATELQVRRELETRGVELSAAKSAAGRAGRELALAEARLEKARERAEHHEASLTAIRAGRSYRLMRVLWRLRRPFRRAPKKTAAAEGSAEAADEVDPSPAAVAPPAADPPPPPRSSPRLSVAPVSAPPPSRQPTDRLRVASILDEMSEACFAPECELLPLGLEGWAEQLDEWRPDLLLVESAWNGNGGEWQYRIAQYPRKDLVGLPALRGLLDGCRERGIPTAFWNKEDPVHFDRFAEAASLFDHVFTTDSRCGARYRALPGERTVTPLPFAAQPRLHNPVAAVEERSASPCFAGAWYRDRHPDRRRALAALLDAARPRGLVIYDRSFGGDDDAFGFPERFQPHVLGGLPYERVLDAYRSHRVFLNANSVADSPTMCSRRVFELAACDTAILSTPGAALSALLGDSVVEAADERGAAESLERLLGDDAARRRRTRAARRAVFAEHTYAERLATIVEAAGLDASSLRREPFATAAPPDGIVPSNGAGDGHPWQLRLLPGIALTEPALADLRAAATYADADVIGTHPANGDAAIEHRYVANLDPRALLVRSELAETRGWPSGPPEQIRSRLREWSDDGIRIYAADADLLDAPGVPS
ncbi:MAG TPA: glycosyltransferase, partial [Solirubrobacterales bacterium]|nr:glycosyltransferase [Solirubrobacterales bacterium]